MNTVPTPESLIEVYQQFLKTRKFDLLTPVYETFQKEAKEILKTQPKYVYLVTFNYSNTRYEKVEFISGKLDDTGNSALVFLEGKHKPVTVAMNKLVRIN